MQSIFWVILFLSFESIVLVSVYLPQFLVKNHFLENFINHGLLNILAIVMTVTAASAANLHFVFNRAEETINQPGYFRSARKEIIGGVYWLIALFLAAVIVLILRSHFIENVVAVSFLNGFGLLILLINVLVLVDVNSTVFAIPPLSPPSDES